MYKKVFTKIWDYSDEKYGSYGVFETKTICFSCSIRDAATERFFDKKS